METRVFNQAVKRNLKRFPSDFMFQLTEPEFENLISQSVTSSWGGLTRRTDRRHPRPDRATQASPSPDRIYGRCAEKEINTHIAGVFIVYTAIKIVVNSG
ncbi:MAG: ORF6N domain-containing protein [Burkholderiaceae bacterium]|nr:ORF6N domain-containing protein [Burkholderiaceae bacterium]